MYRPYMYAYYMLYVYGQSLVLNAIPCVSICDNNIYPMHTCLLYIYIWTLYINNDLLVISSTSTLLRLNTDWCIMFIRCYYYVLLSLLTLLDGQ